MIKRLEADRFKWPKDAAVVELTVEQLHWLLAGRVNRNRPCGSNSGHGDDHPRHCRLCLPVLRRKHQGDAGANTHHPQGVADGLDPGLGW